MMTTCQFEVLIFHLLYSRVDPASWMQDNFLFYLHSWNPAPYILVTWTEEWMTALIFPSLLFLSRADGVFSKSGFFSSISEQSRKLSIAGGYKEHQFPNQCLTTYQVFIIVKWQPTPVFLPGKSHGLRSLVGYSPWGRKELDTTERLHFREGQNGHFPSSLRVCATWFFQGKEVTS